MDNDGRIWTNLILLRIRRLGVRVPPSALDDIRRSEAIFSSLRGGLEACTDCISHRFQVILTRVDAHEWFRLLVHSGFRHLWMKYSLRCDRCLILGPERSRLVELGAVRTPLGVPNLRPMTR